MKKTFKSLATLVGGVLLASSCAIISEPITATSNPVGTKCGTTENIIVLGLYSTNGAQNGINLAAKSAGITKISHVDSYTEVVFFGLIQKQVIKVYGE